MPTACPHEKQIVKHIEALRYRYGAWEAFRDVCECMALSISNGVDPRQAQAREARYLQIVERYRPEDVREHWPAIMGELVLALEGTPRDVLGSVFMGLNLGDKWKGQFFTPHELCETIARLQIGDADAFRAILAANAGVVTVSEPCVGGGAMVLAFTAALQSLGISPHECIHVTAVDIDTTCVHMAYVQLSLCGIPAVVIRGNSLSLEEHDHWFTPFHLLGNWDWRLRVRRMQRAVDELGATETPAVPASTPALALSPEPIPAVLVGEQYTFDLELTHA